MQSIGKISIDQFELDTSAQPQYDQYNRSNEFSNEFKICRTQESDLSIFEAGSLNASCLNLIATTMGAGTVTMPYIISLTGIGLGAILVILGAVISSYSSSLLVSQFFDNLFFCL